MAECRVIVDEESLAALEADGWPLWLRAAAVPFRSPAWLLARELARLAERVRLEFSRSGERPCKSWDAPVLHLRKNRPSALELP